MNQTVRAGKDESMGLSMLITERLGKNVG